MEQISNTDSIMRFTEEQLNTLSAWEDNFRTAVQAQWARNPGKSGLRVIYDIYTSVTGDQRRFNDNCNHCILSLLQDCGRIYFQDTIELATRKANANVKVEFPNREVKVSQEEKQVVKKARVRTTKKTK